MKIAYASIAGNTHRKLDYNNQDFVLVKSFEGIEICLVADGCGSGANSEVGAQLGLNYLAKVIKESEGKSWQQNLGEKLRNYSRDLANNHSENPKDFIRNYLLYTVIGYVMKDGIRTLFSCGDGVKIIEGNIDIINQDNRPNYVNNALLGNTSGEFLFEEIPSTASPILIGSDGVEDLIEGINKGEVSEYPSIEALINDEDNFTNPIQLPRLLQKYSRNGILRDDTTLILIKNES